jgi:H+/Cl- antiporter ClcA
MKKAYLLLLTVVVSVAVALTYHIFETAIHVSIDYVWYHLFNTNQQRLLIIPIGLIISLLYFYTVHHIDPLSERHEEQGMGNIPPPSIRNYLRILFIGFLSLLASASLGPEAILVPACMLIGAYAAAKLLSGDKQASGLLIAASFIALFAAFFNSFIVGLASLLLIMKQAKITFSLRIALMAVIASASSVLMLRAIGGRGLINLSPEYELSLFAFIGLIAAGLAGYLSVVLIRALHDSMQRFHTPFNGHFTWWQNALIASLGLSAIYLLGGPLVQFTGNEAIQPLIQAVPGMSLVAILGIVLAKIIAIAWSKAMGYRGGLIFPSIFFLTGVILIIDAFIPLDLTYGIIAGFVGVFIADRKAKIMFAH